MSNEVVEKDEKNRFVAGVSGNPLGRPKGSKNRVTLLKLVAEESVRERNFDRIQRILDAILTDAENGDKDMRKLVWQSVVSKGSSDDKTSAQEKVEIHINGPREEVRVIPHPSIDQENDDDEQESVE